MLIYIVYCARNMKLCKNILEENYNKFFEYFDTIKYVSPEEDYDGFCKINKENDKRRALSMFYLNLYCIGVLPIDKIEALLVHIMNKLLESMNKPNKTASVEEYTENIAILYKHDIEYNDTILLSNNMNIKDTILSLAGTKSCDYLSLTSKCVFKFMDICEM